MSLAAHPPPAAEESDALQVDPAALERLTREAAAQHHALPVRLDGDRLTVLTPDPRDIRKITAIETITGLRVDAAYASPEELAALIDRYYPAEAPGLRLDHDGTAQQAADAGEEVEENVDSAAVHNVNVIIAEALKKRASDIHLETTADRVRVRYRVDGRLIDHATLPKEMAPSLVARVKVMGNMDIAVRHQPQDGRVAFKWGGQAADLRASTTPGIYGERVVLRVLQKAESIVDVDQLGFTRENLEAFKALINKPYGMLLITGPTGSGKSYTLFSVLRELARPDVNILTIEDPVEYELPGVNQAQLNVRAKFTFANALRAYLRQDPDIIMVGEVRDADTARTATEAALTGHLLLATLHTNDAPSAPGRLVKMGVESYNLAASLLGVLAQRLVRRVCPHCVTTEPPDPHTVKRLGLELDPNTRLKVGRGCEKCNHTGYLGRLAIHELMTVTPAIEDAISDNAPAQDLRDLAIKAGMKTLREDGIQKALAGHTTLEEVLATTLDA